MQQQAESESDIELALGLDGPSTQNWQNDPTHGKANSCENLEQLYYEVRSNKSIDAYEPLLDKWIEKQNKAEFELQQHI